VILPQLKVCLYRTRPRLGGVREGMVEIKQTKVVYTERDRDPPLICQNSNTWSLALNAKNRRKNFWHHSSST